MRYVQFTYPVILLTALLTSCFPVEHEMEEGMLTTKHIPTSVSLRVQLMVELLIRPFMHTVSMQRMVV